MAVAVGEQRRKKEAMDTLIHDIIKGEDENVSAAIRIAIERGWLNSFTDNLAEARKKKEAEIDRICYRHYEDFLTSVGEMLHIRNSAKDLKNLVQDVHKNFNSTGNDLMKVLNELDKIQMEREKTRNFLESTLHCKEMAQSMVKTREEINTKNHYSAIKTLDIIRSEINNVKIEPMVQCLQEWIPDVTQLILNVCQSEMDQHLSIIRDKTHFIGETLLLRSARLTIQNILQSNRYFMGMTSILSNGSNGSHGSTNEKRISLSLLTVYNHEKSFRLSKWTNPHDFDEITPSHYLHDPSPEGEALIDSDLYTMNYFHKAFYIFTKLKKLGEFFQHYREKRDAELENIMKIHERLANQHGLSVAIPQYCERIIGFIIIEFIIRSSVDTSTSSTSSFRSNRQVNGLIQDGKKSKSSSTSSGSTASTSSPFTFQEISIIWDRICHHLLHLCQKYGNNCKSPDELIRSKEDILLLVHTVADPSIGLSTMCLFVVMKQLWISFETAQIETVTKSCAVALENSAYQPLYVDSDTVFITQIRAFCLDSIQLNEETKPSGPIRGQPHRNAFAITASANLDALEEGLDIGVLSHAAQLGPMKGNQKPFDRSFRMRTSSIGSEGMGNEGSKLDLGISSSVVAAGLERTMSSRKSFSPALFHPKIKGNASTNAPSSPEVLLQAKAARMSYRAQAFMAQTFPFSAAIPTMVRELNLLVVKSFIFSSYIDPLDVSGSTTTNEINGNSNTTIQSSGYRVIGICHALQSALSVISTAWLKELTKDGGETPLSKACQISIDSAVLSIASELTWTMVEVAFDQFHWLDHTDHTVLDQMTELINRSSSEIRRVVNQAQDLMFELLSNKIEDLLSSLVFINFEPSEIPKTPHECIEEIIDFLQITFMWLTHLPQSIREAVHFTCCTRVANGMISYILSPKVHQLNVLCIMAFDQDAKRLIQFSDSCGILHLKQCFEELHELIRAVLHPDLYQFGDNPVLRSQLFPRCNPIKLATLLEKIVPVSSNTNFVNAIPKLDRNILKSVAKKLQK